MKQVMKTLLSAVMVTVFAVPATGFTQNITKNTTEIPDNLFVTITFHDVRDDVAREGDRDLYAISTKNLGRYFAWLKQEGWQTISLQDVWDARQKKKKLPKKSVLLTFDDGALSSYTRVFPLLKQYKYFAAFAIPTSWINGNTKDAYEAYGQNSLMSWDQMREMQRSGLVEFVSHSDNMHKGILANPQQSMQPAAITRQFLPKYQRYESDQAYQNRVVEDLQQSKKILDTELGIDTRAIFWPYGAVTKESEELAEKAGLPMSFSLGSMSTLADSGQTYQRALVMNNPTPEMLHAEMLDFLTFASDIHKQRRSYIRFDLAEMVSPNDKIFDQKLGQFLDQISALQTNTILLKTVADENGDGKIDVAYFPNRQLGMRKDLLNRTVWQARTRVGNRVYAELPISLQTKQGLNFADLTAELVKYNSSVEGVMIDIGDELDCAIQKKAWDGECAKKIKQVFDIKDQAKKHAKYYTNISNNYQTVLKITLKDKHVDGLMPLMEYSLNNNDFLYIEFDPVKDSGIFKTLEKQLEKLNSIQKQYLIVSFTVNPNGKRSDWKEYSQYYQELKKLSVQKIGINNYQLKAGQQVQGHLYQDLSINTSPLTYRNPYENNTAKGRK